jgi:hypothetical protein
MKLAGDITKDNQPAKKLLFQREKSAEWLILRTLLTESPESSFAS